MKLYFVFSVGYTDYQIPMAEVDKAKAIVLQAACSLNHIKTIEGIFEIESTELGYSWKFNQITGSVNGPISYIANAVYEYVLGLKNENSI